MAHLHEGGSLHGRKQLAQRSNGVTSLLQLLFHLFEMSRDDLGARRGVVCAQQRLDVGNGHAESAEPADDVRIIDLAGVVEAVAGVRIDVSWFENPDVVIVP